MKRPVLSIAALVLAAALSSPAHAADAKKAEPTPEATPEPTPEPTPIPRPDVLNIKKRKPTDQLLERDFLRLTLLKTEDVPGLKQVPEFSDAGLRKRIFDGFGLPAVMTMREPLFAPPGWWEVEKQGRKAMTLGPTQHYTRPELTVSVPMLRLREVPYIQGDSEFVRAVNEIVRVWTLGRTNEALALREKLQKDKKKIPRGTLERTTVAILSGFLDLQVATEVELPVERYGPALGSLWDALGSTELPIYFPKGENSVDESIFLSTLTEPAIFSDAGVYPPKLTPPRLSPRSVDMRTFARTLALPAVFNVASLSVRARNWTRVYEASQRFDEIYGRYSTAFVSQKSTELNFTTPPGVRVTNPIMMWPRTPHHLKIIMQMLKVNAQFVAEDPLMALKESSRVILNSDVPAFKTIGFAQIANVYDDLGYPNYARRFSAFAEAFADVEWYEQNPYFLLTGGENAFWQGDFLTAKRTFEKFLLSAGDKTYGPWARLRLAEIAHLNEGAEKAALLYSELQRFQERHPVGLIARRRLFCITAPQVGPKARFIEYQALKEFFSKMDAAEVEQIRACHLNGLVEDAGKMATNAIKTLPDDAAVQLELIEEFEKKFPQSAYLTFLQERKTTLQAALGPYLLAFKQCDKAIQFFTENEKGIVSLKKNSGTFLPLLKWGKEEQERLLKCAALFAKKPVVEKLAGELLPNSSALKKTRNRRTPAVVESAEKKLMRLALDMSVVPSDARAEALFAQLRRVGENELWEHIRNLEKQQSQSIDDEKFWVRLAATRVMQWDLEQPAANKKRLTRAMRREVLVRPDRTLAGKELCERFLLESSTLTAREWDTFVLAIPEGRWLELLKSASESSSSGTKSECVIQAAQEALRTAQNQPSVARDRHLLWPWLKAQGAKKEQEAWLALGLRWAKEGSVSKQELEDLFKTLEKEADMPQVKEAARAWRESKQPGGVW